MSHLSLLAVDLTDDIVDRLRAVLSDDRLVPVFHVAGPNETAELVAAHDFDLVVTSDRSVVEVVTRLVERNAEIPCLVICDVDTDEAVVASFRSGARDVVSLNHLARLRPIVDRELRTIADIRRRRLADAELTQAQRIQRLLVPPIVRQWPGLEIAAELRTASTLGGDFYDVFALVDGRVVVVIGDAMGHGAAAALLMVELRTSLRTLLVTLSDLADALRWTNIVLADHTPHDYFATCFVTVIDRARMTLSYVGAAHTAFRFGSGEVERLFSTGPPIGLRSDLDLGIRNEVACQLHDVLLFVTDGIDETISTDGRRMGIPTLLSRVFPAIGESAESLVEHVFMASDEWGAGRTPSDDRTCVVVRFVPSEGSPT